MSLAEKLTSIKTKLTKLLSDCNTALVAKGATEVTSLTEVPTAIESVQSGGEIAKPYIDSKAITNWSSFFARGKNNLEWLDYIDTSNGTDFSSMFNDNDTVTTIPQLDTSKGTYFAYMFYSAEGITTVPVLNTICGTDFTHMFASATKLQSVTFLNTSNGTNFSSMFSRAYKLVSVYGLDVSKAFTLEGLFYDCWLLETVQEPLNCINCNRFTSAFYSCIALKNIEFVPETIKISISFSDSPDLTAESVQSIFDGLATVTSAQTLTLNANTKILQSQVDAANAKGWTVAGGTIVSEEEYYG